MALDPALRQIYAWLAISVVIGGMVIGGVAAAIGRGEFLTPIAGGGALAFVALRLHLQRRKRARLLHSPNSDALVAYYAATMRDSFPNADAIKVHASALAAVAYGEFEKADALMAAVDWNGRGAVFEALPLHVRALTAYLRDHNYELWIALAVRGRSMAEMPRHIPGSATSRLSWDVLVAIGEVLADRPTPASIAALEAGRSKLPFVSGLLATWGLAAARRRADRRPEADALLSELRTAAPYCTQLLDIPAGGDRPAFE
jgi:hypothetical protein